MASTGVRRMNADYDRDAQYWNAIRMTITEELEAMENGGIVDQAAPEQSDNNTSMPTSPAVVEWYCSV